MARRLLIDSLGKGWRDRDEILLHACFQCLVDCVEEEKLLEGHLDWDYSAEQRAVHTELTELYGWWKARTASPDNDETAVNPLHAHEADTAMLLRLVKLRGRLWT